MTIELIAATDRGRVRERNEDVVYVDPELGIALLADGMGGHRSGDLASRLAVEAIREQLGQQLTAARDNGVNGIVELLKDAVIEANQVILARAHAEPQHGGMGTTVVGAVFHDDRLCYVSVGDSRLYRLDERRLHQLTEDHTYEAQMAKLGRLDEPLREPLGKMLVRAVGIDTEIEVDSVVESSTAGDLIMLCSDGLTDVLEDAEIERILRNQPDLESSIARLIEAANLKGGPDNISVILAARQ